MIGALFQQPRHQRRDQNGNPLAGQARAHAGLLKMPNHLLSHLLDAQLRAVLWDFSRLKQQGCWGVECSWCRLRQ
jgi:hypothetical protein